MGTTVKMIQIWHRTVASWRPNSVTCVTPWLVTRESTPCSSHAHNSVGYTAAINAGPEAGWQRWWGRTCGGFWGHVFSKVLAFSNDSKNRPLWNRYGHGRAGRTSAAGSVMLAECWLVSEKYCSGASNIAESRKEWLKTTEWGKPKLRSH